ncbi:MAG: VWA domain-containing protein, partial [Deltaproteobacteria bacterium]|nr:VWA domain-containing protein [Deltaproteobacteria bacterium]
AKRAGHVAALLDQERPNIFTQHVANIEPGKQIEVKISYVETLDWEDGVYDFDFPTVVGPRYIPGNATSKNGTGWAHDTDQVPDASHITPPVTPPGTRSGHDIRISVNLNAGGPIRGIESLQHEIDVDYLDDRRHSAAIRLRNKAEIPNRDFVIRFRTASDEITDTLLTHTDERGKFFTLILQPPKRVPPEWIVPRELIFVIDKSGSMSGFPIETAKATMRRCIENLNPGDTFNLMTFAGGVGFCFPEPVANTQENRRKALEYLQNLRGSGGTEMMKAIHACLADRHDSERLRVVCFMTDGFVGTDLAIIDAVEQNADTARVFSFGIGRSVNRFLLDGMARAGRGDVEYVLTPDESSEASMRFYQRVHTPVLTDVQLEFSGVEVEQVYPKRIPDLFSSKPVVVTGRYLASGTGTITLRGQRGTEKFARTIDLNFPDDEPENDSLASLWARARVEDLMNRDLPGVQRGSPDPGLKDRVVALALRYRLLTQFTSFVAVEETTITEGGESITVTVPVEMPQGVSYEGVFGVLGERNRGVAYKALPNFSNAANIRISNLVAQSASIAPPQSMPPPHPLRKTPSSRRSNRFGGNEEAEEMREFDRKDIGRMLDKLDDDVSLSIQEKNERKISLKLAPPLRGLKQRLQGRRDFAEDRVRVRAGRVEIVVYLTSNTDEALKRLKALGFQLLANGAAEKSLIFGTVSVDKLEALALLDVVEFVEPTRWSEME